MGALKPLLAGLGIAFEGVGLDPVDVDLDVVGHAAVMQRLDQRLVGVLQHRVLAHDRDGDLAVGMQATARDLLPAGQVRFRRVGDAEVRQDLAVQPLAVIVQRHGVDVGGVHRLDDAAFAHVAEQADLALLVGRDRLFAAAQQDVGLDADRAQLLDRVLRRLGLHLAGGLDEGQQGQVDEAGLAARQILAQLADRLEERQALDVADRAPDLHQDEIDVLAVVGQGRRQAEGLDLVGDVRNDLDRRAQVIAAPFLLQDGRIDAARGDVVGLGGRHPSEPLVVTQVQVGLGPVVGDEDLAVLIRAHRARIDVQIGVQLAQADLVAARLQQGAESGGGEAFSERGNHAAGDEHIASHGRTPYSMIRVRRMARRESNC